ncbi:hypothetical protein, partial [Yersinia rochesterensis]|uniref:hypothetical protein n=1 Tax=Yersinia rochesterensis TaxID=1604335 RepID=UPI001F25695E
KRHYTAPACTLCVIKFFSFKFLQNTSPARAVAGLYSVSPTENIEKNFSVFQFLDLKVDREKTLVH